MPNGANKKVGEPRLVTVHRPGVEVGVTLCGGNLRGVYIESLDEDSPARGPDGLLPGDLILEVWIYIYRNTHSNNYLGLLYYIHYMYLVLRPHFQNFEFSIIKFI